ncbi:MAG: hypothetical protein ABI194_07285 [Gemmatimonadaceae bacterium]
MTFKAIIDLLAQHWVVLLLALCPVLIVTMALSALTCEACSAPFGIFRRRNRTIDLCLRCALVHDFRESGGEGGSMGGPDSAEGPPEASDKSALTTAQPLPTSADKSSEADRLNFA